MTSPLPRSGESQCAYGTGLRFQDCADASDRADWRAWAEVATLEDAARFVGLTNPWCQAWSHHSQRKDSLSSMLRGPVVGRVQMRA
jgi:hypothetical protein